MVADNNAMFYGFFNEFVMQLKDFLLYKVHLAITNITGYQVKIHIPLQVQA